MKPNITGKDVAALLHHIHSHYPNEQGDIIYREKDLLPILEALGLPKPIWRESMSVAMWRAKRKLNQGTKPKRSVARKGQSRNKKTATK